MSQSVKKTCDTLSPLTDRSTGVVTFTSRSNAPPNAVLLTKEAALQHQWELFSQWKPTRDVWPVTYGAAISGIAAAFGGIVLNAIFRKHYVLRSIGLAATTLPNFAIPGVLAYIGSTQAMHNIIVMDTQCVVCTQTKATALQLGFGAIYPCIMAPLSCLTIAARSFTYPVPPFRTHYKDILADIYRTFRKHRITLAGLAALQCIVAFGLIHMQMDSMIKVQRKLAEL
ncbi:transmembrane protein 126 isoform X2 [Dermacentor variabilis]|uniref:transmembrane protein 126 isoform X2 n=1 Tax=Dermacentor variabilis TaxID=34621 RepID=UPI003F5BE86E